MEVLIPGWLLLAVVKEFDQSLSAAEWISTTQGLAIIKGDRVGEKNLEKQAKIPELSLFNQTKWALDTTWLGRAGGASTTSMSDV